MFGESFDGIFDGTVDGMFDGMFDGMSNGMFDGMSVGMSDGMSDRVSVLFIDDSCSLAGEPELSVRKGLSSVCDESA